jgi:hypothetical protein
MGTVLVYGKLISEAGGRSFESAFCAFVHLEPPEGLGDGGFEIQKAKMVKLEFRKTPYTLNFDTVVRLDQGRPYFRSAIFFTSDKSGRFDLVLRLKSFSRIAYESDKMRLHLFVPRATANRMELKVEGKEFILSVYS